MGHVLYSYVLPFLALLESLTTCFFYAHQDYLQNYTHGPFQDLYMQINNIQTFKRRCIDY